MRRLRHSKQNNVTIPTMTLTPLIDTVLVLLIVFMVAAPCKIMTPPANKKSQAAQKARNDDYRVTYMYINSNGAISVNGSIEDLRSVLKNMHVLVAQSPIKTVFIKVEDSASSNKSVHALIDAIHNIPGARVIVS